VRRALVYELCYVLGVDLNLCVASMKLANGIVRSGSAGLGGG